MSDSHPWVVFVAIPLVVAVIANALWEYGLRGLFTRLGSALFRGISYGSGRISNGLIRDAARRANPVNRIVLLAILFVTSGGIGMGLAGFTPNPFQPQDVVEMRSELDKGGALPPDQKIEAFEKYRAAIGRAEARFRRVEQCVYISITVNLIFLFTACLRALVINNMIDNFEWRIARARSDLTDAELHEIERDWALMQNAKDLDAMNRRLDGAAQPRR